MASVIASNIKTERQSSTINFVDFEYILDTGLILKDGTRYFPIDADLQSIGAELGPRLLEAAVQQEIQQWLSP